MARERESGINLLRSLEYFIAAAEHGGIGAAAEALGTAQPPVSQSIRRLEDDLGVRLFDRTPGGVRLTDGGRELLPRARLLSSEASRLRAVAREASSAPGRMRLGFARTLPDHIITSVLNGLRRPGVEVAAEPVVEPARAIVAGLREGALDQGIVDGPVVSAGLLASRPLRADAALALPEGGRVEGLRDGVLAWCTLPRTDNPPAFDALADQLAGLGLEPEHRPVARPAELLALVAAGAAAAVVVRGAHLPPGIQVRPLPGVRLSFTVLSRPGADDDGAAQRVETALRRTLRTL